MIAEQATAERKPLLPRTTRDGTIQIPTAWMLLANGINTATDAEQQARFATALAGHVLAASEAAA